MVQWQLLSLILPFYSQRMSSYASLEGCCDFSEGLGDDVERLCTRCDSMCTYVGSNVIL